MSKSLKEQNKDLRRELASYTEFVEKTIQDYEEDGTSVIAAMNQIIGFHRCFTSRVIDEGIISQIDLKKTKALAKIHQLR